MNPFEELLSDLGKALRLKLSVDTHGACSLLVHENLPIQLQLDPEQKNLWIFSPLAEIPAGKFREEVLKEALKSNAEPDPKVGLFGYIARTNQLALFLKLPLEILRGQLLAELLGSFIEMASLWKEAIENGQSAPLRNAGKRSP